MSASMSLPSLSLSHYLVISFGASISQCCSVFSVLPSHNLCFYAGDTHFYSHLRVTSLDSRPKRQQSGPTSGSQGSKCEHIGEGGSRSFRGDPNTSIEFGPGVQLLRGSKYYVTDYSPCRHILVLANYHPLRYVLPPSPLQLHPSKWTLS